MTAQPDLDSNANAAFVGHIVLDVPAEYPTLSFSQIAEALASIVLASEPRFSIGIFGGWGSGKSTLMDEIGRLVAERQNQAIVVQFNAWRYEREPHLIIPLLDTMRAALSDWAAKPENSGITSERVSDIARRVGRVVRALVRATSLNVGLPGAVSVTVEPGKALDEMSTEPGDAAASPQSLYYAAFQELSAAFADVRSAGLSRIIVFVDDLDRCLPEQALTVLESMKLFFDMPGFVFVVGLDQRVMESAVQTKFAIQDNGGSESGNQAEREYLKKIFQVPYTLPAMAPGQLTELLAWLAEHGQLGDVQRQDLQERVRNYLQYVATQGRINPREVKRFINAYTLNRMIRPDLNPDTVLALQAFGFRDDWEQVYEDIVLSEPDVFVEALGHFRDGDSHAFEDLWPDIGVLPLELSVFLRSDAANALAETKDLERYVTLLETTRTTQSWVKHAMHDVGLLRRHIREVPPALQFGGAAARDMAVQIKDILGRLGSYQSGADAARLESPLEKLKSLVKVLAPSTTGPAAPDETEREQLEQWRANATTEVDALLQELRLIRRSSAFGGS